MTPALLRSHDRLARWLFIDLDSFFASVEQQLQPHLRGRPVAVGPRDMPFGTIVAASYEAKAFGVRTGQRVREALALCPHLVVTGSGHGAYSRFHEAVKAEVQRHTAITHVASIDEFACRLTDDEAERWEPLARAIKRGIRERVGECIGASVGVAPNRLVAKIACDMNKPDGLKRLTAADLPHALHHLKLTDIPGIAAATEARLKARGITSIAQLAAQPNSRLGLLLHGHELADGARRSRSVGHSHVLAPAKRDVENVCATARRLLLRAAARLRDGGLEARNLTLVVRPEGARAWSCSARVPPTADSFALLEALDSLLPRLRAWAAEGAADGARVRTVGVSLHDVRPCAGEQMSLFAALHPDSADARAARGLALSRAIDAVHAKFGRDALTLGAHQPDRPPRIAFGRIPRPDEYDAL